MTRETYRSILQIEPNLKLIQPSIQRVRGKFFSRINRPGSEDRLLHPASKDACNVYIYTSTITHAFMLGPKQTGTFNIALY
jgi:hypothetical protein